MGPDVCHLPGRAARYPQYRKVTVDEMALYRFHRQDDGPSASHEHRHHRGGRGRVPPAEKRQATRQCGEWFIAGIKPGKCFIFVRTGSGARECPRRHCAGAEKKESLAAKSPHWQGGKSPLSSELSAAVADKLLRFREGVRDASPEMQKVAPILRIQSKWSLVPRPDEMLIERVETKAGHHLYLYPFGGRLVNAALGTLVGYRMGREKPLSMRVTPNAITAWSFTVRRCWSRLRREWRTLLSLTTCSKTSSPP